MGRSARDKTKRGEVAGGREGRRREKERRKKEKRGGDGDESSGNEQDLTPQGKDQLLCRIMKNSRVSARGWQSITFSGRQFDHIPVMAAKAHCVLCREGDVIYRTFGYVPSADRILVRLGLGNAEGGGIEVGAGGVGGGSGGVGCCHALLRSIFLV